MNEITITFGRIKKAEKIVIYGPEGIGKSTFASRFPDALFIDIEGSTNRMNVARLPAPPDWEYLNNEINYVLNNPTCCKTLVIDTADWAEQLCVADLCRKNKKSGIEAFGYGKGYVYLMEEFGKILRKLEQVIALGIYVVITAHAKMRKFELPEENGAYDRWELKLTKQVAPLLKEWADCVFFANYKIHSVHVGDDKYKAQGGERVMYTTHHPCWDAKNRWGMEDEVPFTYESIRQFIEEDSAPQSAPETTPQTQFIQEPDNSQIHSGPVAQVSFVQIEQEQKAREQEAQKAANAPHFDQASSFLPPDQREPDIPKGTPPKLAKLMKQDSIDAAEVQMAVFEMGAFPMDTPITAYPPDFVEFMIQPEHWKELRAMIDKEREDCPF